MYVHNATISDEVPALGAGRIEVVGARDIYTFRGTAGQSVLFEELSVAPALAGALRWECKTPGGRALFTSIFSSKAAGRRTLPESGTYTIQCCGDNDPVHVGDYSFRTTGIPDDGAFAQLRVSCRPVLESS